MNVDYWFVIMCESVCDIIFCLFCLFVGYSLTECIHTDYGKKTKKVN